MFATLRKITDVIISHNWLVTIYINFRVLPIKQAIHLPIDIYRGIRINSISGQISITSNKLWRGMIKIGGRGSDMFSGRKVILDVQGNVEFSGQTEIGYGTFVHVSKGAKLTFGNKVRIGALCKIYCDSQIVFGNEVGISWESQIFDTNFHYFEDIYNGRKFEKTKPIKIGSYNWFGNRCNIMKGTITPDWLIVASNSMTNKDYTEYESQYAVLAGSPAKVVKTGVRRVFDND